MTALDSGNKYGNNKIVIDGIEFDSQAEGERYLTLKIMRRKGLISDLKLQVKYELIPSKRRKIDNKLERACSYYADFVYKDQNGVIHVEDVKGVRTPEYVIKRKLMLYFYGIEIEEIEPYGYKKRVRKVRNTVASALGLGRKKKKNVRQLLGMQR